MDRYGEAFALELAAFVRALDGGPVEVTGRDGPRGGRRRPGGERALDERRGRASRRSREEVGIGLLGVGWMGEVHSTSYRRVPVHYPDCEARARLVVAADEVEDGRAAPRRGWGTSARRPTGAP